LDILTKQGQLHCWTKARWSLDQLTKIPIKCLVTYVPAHQLRLSITGTI